jgi:hypothetical protein
MKKSLLILFSALAFSFGLTSMTSNNAEYSAGKAGSNGSPGEGTCATGNCHNTSAADSGPGSVSVNIEGLLDGNMYVPGQAYQVSVTVQQQGIGLFGFGLESLQASGANAGTWTPASDSHVLNATVNGNSRATITHIDNSGFSSNSRTWTFTWNAPSSAIPVNMYAAGNAANANNARTGDFIYTLSLALMPAPVLEAPVVSVEGDLALCPGETAQLFVTPQSGASYAWFDASGNSLGDGQSLVVLSEGCYTVQATLGSQAVSSEEICFFAEEAANAEFSGLNQEYCLNAESSQLLPVDAGGLFSGPGISNDAFNPSAAGPGIHEVSYAATSPAGCTDVFTQTVTVFDLPMQDIVLEGDGITLSAMQQGDAQYQWINCDSATEVAGATQSQLTLSDEIGNGNYAVQITLNGCSVTSDCVALISQYVGVVAESDAAWMFPNPAGDFVQLVTRHQTEWKMYDAQGQLVLSGIAREGDNRIDIASLSSGLYTLQMLNGKQWSSTSLMIQ